MIQFDDHIFQMGWFNHQQVDDLILVKFNNFHKSDFPNKISCEVVFM